MCLKRRLSTAADTRPGGLREALTVKLYLKQTHSHVASLPRTLFCEALFCFERKTNSVHQLWPLPPCAAQKSDLVGYTWFLQFLLYMAIW